MTILVRGTPSARKIGSLLLQRWGPAAPGASTTVLIVSTEVVGGGVTATPAGAHKTPAAGSRWRRRSSSALESDDICHHNEIGNGVRGTA